MKRGRKPVNVKGTHGLKGEKVARERIMRAVNRRLEGKRGQPKYLDMIVQQLVDQAMNGEAWAIREILDRLDGKPVASVESKQEGSIEYVFRWAGEPIDVTPRTALEAPETPDSEPRPSTGEEPLESLQATVDSASE